MIGTDVKLGSILFERMVATFESIIINSNSNFGSANYFHQFIAPSFSKFLSKINFKMRIANSKNGLLAERFVFLILN